MNTIDRQCTGGQLTELGLIILDSARSDMRQFCLRAEDLVAQIYYPVEAVPGDPLRSHCALVTAALGEKLFDRALELRAQALNRIAVRFLAQTQKLKLLNRIAKRLSRMRERIVAVLVTECPEFETTYNRSPETFATSIEESANCALSFLYVQDAVLCPR